MQRWNWQQDDWPHFTWERGKYDNISESFVNDATKLADAYQSLKDEERLELLAEFLAEEAFHTSDIEGEHLDRDLVYQSIFKQFGSKDINPHILGAEEGIGQLMHDLYESYDEELSHEMLFKWHQMLMEESQQISDIGKYRTHKDAMQVVSYSGNRLRIHYEAPPSDSVPNEMNRFILWYNDTLKARKLSVIEHAALTHHYFVMIHPFEDGNGRIGRALTLKSLSGSLRVPRLLSLSSAINGTRKRYYSALEASNQSNGVDLWLEYFSEVALLAQEQTLRLFDFITKRLQFYETFSAVLNERQKKVIERIFKEGPKGFDGGLSVDNYIRITKASHSTAVNDLADLVQKGAIVKSGEFESSRYSLKLEYSLGGIT